jgi:hypothetical protein
MRKRIFFTNFLFERSYSFFQSIKLQVKSQASSSTMMSLVTPERPRMITTKEKWSVEAFCTTDKLQKIQIISKKLE